MAHRVPEIRAGASSSRIISRSSPADVPWELGKSRQFSWRLRRLEQGTRRAQKCSRGPSAMARGPLRALVCGPSAQHDIRRSIGRRAQWSAKCLNRTSLDPGLAPIGYLPIQLQGPVGRLTRWQDGSERPFPPGPLPSYRMQALERNRRWAVSEAHQPLTLSLCRP